MIYNGLSFSSTELSGSPYINFASSVIVELFGMSIGQIVYGKFGRKIPYVMSLTGSGLALLSFLFIPKGKLILEKKTNQESKCRSISC